MKEISRSYELEFIEVAILKQYAKLGPNAQQVLIALLDRLVKGIEHGDFDKPHDWDKESSEEALDLAVYQAAKLLGLGKANCAPCTARGHGYPSRFADCPECGGEAEEPKPEELYTFGHVFIHGKYYTRFHEGPSYNPRVTLVDSDGRTSDGMPWVPPTGARVRVVHTWRESAFLRKGGDTTRTFTVKSAEAHDEDEAAIDFKELPSFGYLLRVVPAGAERDPHIEPGFTDRT